jgi:exodeoxyribonuclease V alpha subunit
MMGESERLALALLVLAVSAAERQGSTRLPLRGDALGQAGSASSAARPSWRSSRPAVVRADPRSWCADPRPGLVSLIGRPGEDRPLIATRERGGDPSPARLRERLAAFVRGARPRASSVPFIESALDRGRRAARCSCLTSSGPRSPSPRRARFAVVSGGPGTGKTAICAALCRALVRTRHRAVRHPPWPPRPARRPSGSAPRCAARWPARCKDSTSRLAGWPPSSPRRAPSTACSVTSPRAGRFRHHAGAPLLGQVVIVDEASMVDLVLMEKLTRALAPGTRLVLFGDADQLPSVEAGAVPARPGPPRTRAGSPAATGWTNRIRPGGPSSRPLARCAPGGSAAGRRPIRRRRCAWSTHWFESHIAGGGRWAELARAVSRMEGGAAATASSTSSRATSSRAACYRSPGACGAAPKRSTGSSTAARRPRSGSSSRRASSFCPASRWCVRENDHARGLYNGDCGLVAAAGRGADGLRAVFAGQDGSWRVFPLAALRPRLELAYALTVHQSQGSEYDHVALVLPDVDMPLATRELVYTALTRARRSIALFGSAEVLRAAVARSADRFSGLDA